MLQLKARPKRRVLPPRQDSTNSVVVECPKCKAVITIINAEHNTKRYCWRCLEDFSFKVN